MTTPSLFTTPAEMVDAAARAIDPDAFDDDARLPDGRKRWVGSVAKAIRTVDQTHARELARHALSVVYPTLKEEGSNG